MVKIFDVIKDKEVIIRYNYNQVEGLKKVLKCNNILCENVNLDGYAEIRINDHTICECSTEFIANRDLQTLSCEKLVDLINL